MYMWRNLPLDEERLTDIQSNQDQTPCLMTPIKYFGFGFEISIQKKAKPTLVTYMVQAIASISYPWVPHLSSTIFICITYF